MKTYTLGLNVAGDIQFVIDIPAKNFGRAALEWARITGHLDCLYDGENHTYFGWPVVETKKKALQRKSNPNSFQY